ncbi:chorismate lyase [Orrella sp. JC864]|uniref:chorismate--pyruvate lyase family protein n=1 Tax=Orrella sp. JC864 TaxID=3120298 RepID=UPI00300B8D6D
MNAASVSRPGWLPSAPPSLAALHRYWLFRPGALTAGLRALGRFELRVLREYAGGAPADEAHGMGLAAGTPVWIREVVMAVNGADCVAARSLTPLAASHGVWQGMRRLRTRPLADMLYHDRSVQRSAFEVARLHARQALHKTVRGLPCAGEPHVRRPLARRSVFRRLGQPLMVEECFLPAFWRQAQARADWRV